MKRLSVPVLVVVSIVLAACKGNEQQAAAPPVAPPAAAPAQAAPASTASAATAAVPSVAELPDYPGATRVKLQAEVRAGFTKTIEAKFTTADTFDNVKKFYVDAIATNGWQVSSVAEKPGEVKWLLAKGTSTGKVEIENEHGTLQIKLERSDK